MGTKYYNSTYYLLLFKLIFTDTDKLVCEIEKNYVLEDFYENKNLLVYSDYPEDSNFLNPVNKKTISKMKDKVKGKILCELVGLICIL